MANKYFNDLTKLLEFLQTPNPVANLSMKRGGYQGDWNWFGTQSMPEAIRFAKEGWLEGTEKIEKFTSLFANKLVNSLKIDEYFYDVTGQDFDLDRVLIGEPEAWLNTEQVEVKAPAQHNVKILVNVGALVGVSARTILTKGSAIAALVLLLERARRGVEIEVVSSALFYGCPDSEAITVRMLLKRSGEDMDLGKLAFVLSNAAFLRRFVFGVRERVGDTKQKAKMASNSYGSSQEVEQEDADIYAPINNGTMYFHNDDAATRWILEELAKQGVELKGEG